MNNKLYLFIFIISSLLGCNNTSVHISHKSLIQDYPNKSKDYNIYFIIPGAGCPGCITNAELFFKNNIDNKNIRYIFTSIESEKLFRMKFGDINTNFSNIIIDFDSKYSLPESDENAIYPCILYLNGNKILKTEFVSPSTPDALKSLQKTLNENNLVKIDLIPFIKESSSHKTPFLSTILDKIVEVNLICEEPINLIRNCIVTNNYILVLDNSLKIFVFNINGQFISKIDRLGNGPKEYNKILSIDADFDRKEIYVLDYKKLLIYTLDGKFVRDIKLDQVALQFCNLSPDYFFMYFPFYETDNTAKQIRTQCWCLIDKDGSTRKVVIENEKPNNNNQSIVYKPFLQKGNNEIYFALPHDNFIYRLKNNYYPEKILLVNQGDLFMPEEIAVSLSDKKEKYINQLLITASTSYFS